ncbi:MAG: YhcH/YjgK/YiaL family protein [Spirochaetota bacterium]
MILTHVRRMNEYRSLHPDFSSAFDFLTRIDLSSLADDRYDIAGERVYATISTKQGRARSEGKLEAHRSYIDIQYVISGIDEMGWKHLSACTKVNTTYDAEKDYELFDDAPDAWIRTCPKHVAVFFPSDAHTPLISKEVLRKVVIKVHVR